MSITLACGHTVQDFDESHGAIIKAWTINEEGWQKAIEYKSLCKTCYEEHKAEGYLLNTEQEEINWLKESA